MRSKGRNRKGEPISLKKVKVTTLCMCWGKLSSTGVSLHVSSTLVVVAAVHVVSVHVAPAAPIAYIASVAYVAHAIARVLDNRIGVLITLPYV